MSLQAVKPDAPTAQRSVGPTRKGGLLNRAGAVLATLLLFVTPALLLPAAPAWAQVAVPSLVPGGILVQNPGYPIFAESGYTPLNPAAMQFGAPSRIGGGVMQGASNDTIWGGNGKNYTGVFGGARLVVQRIALAVENNSYSVQYPTATISESNESFAFSFSFPEWLAFGFGADNHTREVGVTKYDVMGTTFGVSLKSENFGAGMALGQETARDGITKGARDTTVTGVSWREGGKVSWHLEYNIIAKGFFEDSAKVQVMTPDFFGHETHQALAEVVVNQFLIGYRMVQSTAQPGVGDLSLNGYALDVGYMPFEGPTITGRYEFSERKLGSTREAAEKLYSVQAGYQF